ncbi:hypothetical protein D3C80_1802890 [compost metagenome]
MKNKRIHPFLHQQHIITLLRLNSSFFKRTAEADPAVPEAAGITDRTNEMLLCVADSQQMIA